MHRHAPPMQSHRCCPRAHDPARRRCRRSRARSAGGTGVRGRGDPGSGARDRWPGRFQAAQRAQARGVVSADPGARAGVAHRIRRSRGDRCHQHPAGDPARHAPRRAGAVAGGHPCPGRRQPRAGRPALRGHRDHRWRRAGAGDHGRLGPRQGRAGCAHARPAPAIPAVRLRPPQGLPEHPAPRRARRRARCCQGLSAHGGGPTLRVDPARRRARGARCPPVSPTCTCTASIRWSTRRSASRNSSPPARRAACRRWRSPTRTTCSRW